MRHSTEATVAPSGWRAALNSLVRLSALVAVFALLGHFGHWHWLVDLCAHFRWQYLLAMLPGLAAAIFLRRMGAVALLAVASILNLWSLVSATGQAPDGGDAPVRASPSSAAVTADRWKLLVVNIHLDNRDLGPLLALIEQESPDVVGILELSPYAATALAKLEWRYPISAVDPRDDPFGIGLWSRLPNSRIESAAMPPLGLPALQLQWTEPQPGKLWLVHPFPPISGEATGWRDAQLTHVAELMRGDADAVLAGDLNITPWSAAYRRLRQDAGLHDSSATRLPWPTWFGPGIGSVLAIPIDHVLHGKALRVLNHKVGPDVGSDHRPVIVELTRAALDDPAVRRR